MSVALLRLKSQVELQVLPNFPAVRFGFAYGSGAFPQENNPQGEGTMLDLVFSVDDSQQWHRDNMARNPLHYAWLPRRLGPSFATALQRVGPAKVFFNPYVTLPGFPRAIKYGVVDHSHLVDDLSCWSSLYFAGRLHKPVLLLVDDPGMLQLIQSNRAAALAVAALVHPLPRHEVSDAALFQTLAALSYTGDVRMSLRAENPHKPSNIVRGHLSEWREVYKPIIAAADPRLVAPLGSGDTLRVGQLSLAELMPALPSHLVAVLDENFRFTRELPASPENDRDRLIGALSQIVGYSSISQTLKGLLTAGIAPSFRYVMDKLSKR